MVDICLIIHATIDLETATATEPETTLGSWSLSVVAIANTGSHLSSLTAIPRCGQQIDCHANDFVAYHMERLHWTLQFVLLCNPPESDATDTIDRAGPS